MANGKHNLWKNRWKILQAPIFIHKFIQLTLLRKMLCLSSRCNTHPSLPYSAWEPGPYRLHHLLFSLLASSWAQLIEMTSRRLEGWDWIGNPHSFLTSESPRVVCILVLKAPAPLNGWYLSGIWYLLLSLATWGPWSVAAPTGAGPGALHHPVHPQHPPHTLY